MLAGAGLGADTNLLTERPRSITTKILGTIAGQSFTRYGNSFDDSGNRVDGPGDFITRSAAPDQPLDLAHAVFQTSTQISAFDAASVVAVTGNLSTSKYADPSGDITYTSTNNYLGMQVSQNETTLDPFGNATFTNDSAIDSTQVTDTAGTPDSFGRVTSDSVTGGLSDAATYSNPNDNTASWFGPGTITGQDHAVTKLTYNQLGLVKDDNQSTLGLETKPTYDAAGNVTATSQTGTDAQMHTLSSSTSDTYDAAGRITSATDALGRKTTWAYSFDGTYNVVTITEPTKTLTNPDGTTSTIVPVETDKYYLDGTPASVSGNAVTPATYSEGVVATDTTDSNGKVETAGSTWTKSTTDGTSDNQTSFTNMLGEQYLTQQTGPTASAVASGQTAYADATAGFDSAGRQISSGNYDGSVSDANYNPTDGLLGSEFLDVAGTGAYDAGKDPKLTFDVTNTGGYTGTKTTLVSNTGNQSDQEGSANGGLSTGDVVDGTNGSGGFQQTSTDAPTGSAGGWTSSAVNTDGTKVTDSYAADLLSSEGLAGTGGAPIISNTLTYDPLKRVNQITDYTGTTGETYFADGSTQSVTLPDHSPMTANAIDPITDDATTTTLADGTTQYTPENALNLPDSQSGSGLLTAKFGYDTGGTGNLTSLTTYAGTPGASSGSATTSWAFDPATGELQSKTFADGSQDQWQYNAAGQLKGVIEPGISASSFGYDKGGNLTSWSLTDSSTGVVSSATQLDDQFRPTVLADSDNGKTFTTMQTYTSLGQPLQDTFTSAGGASVSRAYWLPTDVPATATASPGDIRSLTLALPNGQSSTQQSYAYDSSSKFLSTITVNGITFTMGYLPDSSQVQSVTAGKLTTTYAPDSSDGARLGELSVTGNGQTLYDEYVGYYAQNDQRGEEDVARLNPDGTTEYYCVNYTSDSHYQITDVNDSTNDYPYNFDNAGNLTGTSLGTANSVNEYSNLSYNSRGDVTNNGTYTIAWDAADRPITITPNHVVTGSLQIKLGYDSQDRWLWKDVYSWSGTAWVYAYSRRAVWDGSSLVAELDQNNTLVKGYTWTPDGSTLLAVTDYSNPSSPKTFATIADASGNIVELADPLTGNVVAAYHYDPYGNLRSASGPQAALCPFLGKGLYVHSEAPGLMFAAHRVTDGRIWLSRDPSGESGGLNLYQLYGGDPVNNSDPSELNVVPPEVRQREESEANLLRLNWMITHPDVHGPPPADELAAEHEIAHARAIDQSMMFVNSKAELDALQVAAEASAQIAPAPSTPPSIAAYPPPTLWQKVKQGGCEILAGFNNNTGALVNMPATVINNQIYDWNTNFQHPIFDDRSGMAQLPTISPESWQLLNDYGADPRADAHIATLTKSVGVLESVGTYYLSAESAINAAQGRLAAAENAPVVWNNGWRTADGKFASPQGPGLPGATAQTAVWDAVEAKPNWQVIRGRVSVRGAAGQLRVYDGAAITPSGRVIGLEVKSGTGILTAQQRAFDAALNASGPETVPGVGMSLGIQVRRAVEIRQPGTP